MPLHTIPPVYDESSEILILGSFPSVRSREVSFFYGHPQNRFWKVLERIFEEKIPDGILGKQSFLLSHRIALWDVIASCEIKGSSDSSVSDVVPNDISPICNKCRLKKIFLNGKTAEKYYNKYIKPTVSCDTLTLPSTSAANASFSLDRLVCEWSVLKEILG